MKRFLLSICAALLVIAAPSGADAQDKKELRQLRKEQRKREKEIEDSVRAVIFGTEQRVNVGYGTTKKKNLTTAVSSVEIDDRAMSSYGDIGEYLSGRVPGLIVTKVGGSYRFQIRGAATIGVGSTEPLVLVDGAETSDISALNPHDIKSVEVLKDAAASSIYGSRAASGVILITTKR